MSEKDAAAAERARGAAIFAQPDVVASYYARQPYAPAAYEALLAQVAGRRRVLDIGCGPGPVALELAPHFTEVVALDPSAGMIAAGKAADADAHPNIRWLCARAEDYEDPGELDLVVAGSSIHWVDPAVIYPKLVGWTPIFAVLGNDGLFPWPPPPCGLEAWVTFIRRWNTRIGRVTPPGWGEHEEVRPPAVPHEPWMDVVGRERFRFVFRQSVSDFVTSCHSRASWAPAVMGEAVAVAFDAELTALLEPHAIDGLLELDIITDLCWGAPRASPHT